MNRELLRWGLPAVAMLVVFVLYTSIAAIVLVASDGPATMVAAADGEFAEGGGFDSDDDGTSTGSDSETDEPDAATGTETDPEPEAPAVSPPNAACEELFSASVVSAANANGLVLNPSWADGSAPGGLGLQDAELADMLANVPSIDCRWLNPNGGSGAGIRTTVSTVTNDQAAWINGRLAALGYTGQSELGGTRYFFENKAGTPFGESHIVVNGVWFATHWLSYGPKGYTADVVTNYFN